MSPNGIEVAAPIEGRQKEILTDEALQFVEELHRRFDSTRRELLERRAGRQAALHAGEFPDFLTETRWVREGDWQVDPVPADLQDRRVEITGPTERKMVINALNSGASVFMADFEDSNTPAWENVLDGQVNLTDAVRRTIELVQEERTYRLEDQVATLLVRPRGWHLVEKHVRVGGEPVSASLFDFGLYFFHNAAELLERGSGPYFYLPKLESHLEARLWDEVFAFSEQRLGIPEGTVKATVLIETILAAFEMEEILHELRRHSAGLNAGRWDYIFSIIKKFRHLPDFLLPDRGQVRMTVPFMRAYTELLVRSCHRRRAHAIGGMAAFIPSRKNREINEKAFAEVRDDKVREAGDGFDGTWVAHPDLVPVAKQVFDDRLGDRPNQVDRLREDVQVEAGDLLDVQVPAGTITEQGLRNNVSVGLLYLESWLRGVGAAAIYNLMEDTATAEISRSQVWQWVHQAATISAGPEVTSRLVEQVIDEELDEIRGFFGEEQFAAGRFEEARQIFQRVALGEEFVEFLTWPAYDYLD
ncbi:MAG: malate synthase A [Actinomycetota bacterium]|nr:malate synthase A [Actinomycetota bacterium]